MPCKARGLKANSEGMVNKNGAKDTDKDRAVFPF